MLTGGGPADLFEQFVQWANRERSVKAVVLFGSQVREAKVVGAADRWSDFDIQVVTARPRQLLMNEWIGNSFKNRELLVRAVRPASAGVKKITLIFRPSVEFDIIVVPAFRMQLARYAIKLGLQNHIAIFKKSLNELAYVLKPGYRLIKGGRQWKNFYFWVVGEMRGTRLNDSEIVALAELFICDVIWVRRMIDRGELIAAQRTLHRSLAEINFQFFHELRLRNQQTTFREARRIEFITTPKELSAMSIDSRMESRGLSAALDKTCETYRDLVFALIGERWKWPAGIDKTSKRL